MSPGRSVLTTTFQNSDKTQLWVRCGGGRGVTIIITCHHHWWSPGHCTGLCSDWSHASLTVLWLAVTSCDNLQISSPPHAGHLISHLDPDVSHTRSLGTVEKGCNLNWIVSQIVPNKNWAEIWTHETISAVIAKQKPITIIIGSGMPLDNSVDILHFTLLPWMTDCLMFDPSCLEIHLNLLTRTGWKLSVTSGGTIS